VRIVKLHGNIDDPVLEDILRMLTKEFGHEWSGKIARFSDNLWIACGHGEMRKFSISLHGDYLIAKPIYAIETGEKY